MAMLRRVAIAFLGGLGASIAIAWVSVFVVDGGVLTRQRFVDPEPIIGDQAVGIDPMVGLMSLCDAPVAIGALFSGGRLERAGNGLSADGLFGACEARDDPSGYDFAEARGWPFLCVWYGERTSRTLPFATETEGGVVVGRRPAGTRGFIGSGAKVLAYRPLPAGLALDTLIYGGAIFGAMKGWTRLARRRRGPGRCARCGYSLAGLASGARCPECGAHAVVTPPEEHLRDRRANNFDGELFRRSVADDVVSRAERPSAPGTLGSPCRSSSRAEAGDADTLRR